MHANLRIGFGVAIRRRPYRPILMTDVATNRAGVVGPVIVPANAPGSERPRPFTNATSVLIRAKRAWKGLHRVVKKLLGKGEGLEVMLGASRDCKCDAGAPATLILYSTVQLPVGHVCSSNEAVAHAVRCCLRKASAIALIAVT